MKKPGPLRYEQPRPGRRAAGMSLAPWTTFRLGGPCVEGLCCGSPDALCKTLAELRNSRCKGVVLGGGSNVLISDHGLDAAVVRFADAGSGLMRDGCRVRASGGVNLDRLVQWTLERGLGDFSFASGIPGTVGAAVRGNAGAFGEAVGDRIERVRVLSADHRAEWRSRDDMGFGYRRTEGVGAGEIVLEAEWLLEPRDRASMRRRRAEVLAWRRRRHPRWMRDPCAGSVFRNPRPRDREHNAGALLERAGAHSLTVGGARVFESHANIVVADGSACTAQDVASLMAAMQRIVMDACGVLLEPEIVLLGRFDEVPIRGV